MFLLDVICHTSLQYIIIGKRKQSRCINQNMNNSVIVDIFNSLLSLSLLLALAINYL